MTTLSLLPHCGVCGLVVVVLMVVRTLCALLPTPLRQLPHGEGCMEAYLPLHTRVCWDHDRAIHCYDRTLTPLARYQLYSAVVSTTCTTVYVALSCVDRVRRGNDVSRLPMCVLDVTGHVSIDHSKNGNAYTRPPRKTYWAGCTITSVMSSMSITLSWTLVLYPILRKLGSCMVVLVWVDC